MEANTENSNEDEQQAEQERNAAAAAGRQQEERDRIDAAALSRRRFGLIVTVLKGCDEFPFRTKNKTNELVEKVFNPGDAHHQQHEELQQVDDDVIDQRDKRRRLQLINTFEGMRECSPRYIYIELLVRTFLQKLRQDVHHMLCDNNIDPDSDNYHNYRGLDSKRDTEAEVEAILRLFPEVLTRTKPIQLFARNLKAVSFIPLVARLSVELGLFEEQYRGGLLFTDASDGDHNPLQNLMNSEDHPLSNGDNYNQEHHEDRYVQVLIKLRQLDLLKKEDIQNFDLLHHLCHRPFFSKTIYCFLIEWDLNAVLQTDECDDLPLHNAAINMPSIIQVFQFVFEAGIKYFPKKKGIYLLFRKNSLNYTPFQCACQKFGQEQVMKVVDDTLGYYSGDTPMNITEALVMAVTDENIHLDCVYFLLRREPDVLQKLLSSSTAMEAMATVMDKNNNIKNDNDSGNNDNSDQTKTLTKKKRKRK